MVVVVVFFVCRGAVAALRVSVCMHRMRDPVTLGGHAVPLAARDAGTTERRTTITPSGGRACSDYNDDDKLHGHKLEASGRKTPCTHTDGRLFFRVLVVVYCGHRCEDWQAAWGAAG